MFSRRPALPRPAADSRPDPPASALLRTIVAATLVAALLRLFRLGHQSLWIDELFTVGSAGLQSHFAWHDLLEDVHAPLLTLLLRGLTPWLGVHEWTLRLPSAIAGILAVPAIAWVAHRWLGARAVAPAAWLAAGSPFLVWYAQECRGYSLLILFSCLALGALLALRERFDVRRVSSVIAASAAAVLSNFSFLLLTPLALRWAIADGPSRARRVGALAIGLGLLVVLALPWAGSVTRIWDWKRLAPGRHAVEGEMPLRGSTTNHVAAIPFALHAFAEGYTIGPSLRELRRHPSVRELLPYAPELLATTVVFGTLGMLGLAAIARRRRVIDLSLWCIAPALVVSYFAGQNFKVFHPRYLAVSMPALLLVCAAGFADARPRTRRVLAFAVGALWTWSLASMAFDPEVQREDYRGALSTVRQHLSPGERILAVGAPEPVEFYASGLPVTRWWLGFASQPARMRATFDDSLASAPGAWIVLSRSEDLDPQDRFAHWMDERVAAPDRYSRPGIRVWHWRRSSSGAAREGDRPS